MTDVRQTAKRVLEIRLVDAGWKHPVLGGIHHDGTPRYRGLLKAPYKRALTIWQYRKQLWDGPVGIHVESMSIDPDGFMNLEAIVAFEKDLVTPFERSRYGYERPDPSDYMPDVLQDDACIMVYDQKLGTPVSPTLQDSYGLMHWAAHADAPADVRETLVITWGQLLQDCWKRASGQH